MPTLPWQRDSAALTAFTKPAISRARPLLLEARELERAGRVSEAAEAYSAAADAAGRSTEAGILAEALRRLGNIRRRRHETAEAIGLYQQSQEVATEAGDNVMAAEALNGLALVEIERGEWGAARAHLHRALYLGSDSGELCGRIQQNLGIMANIHGDFVKALSHYQRSLEAFRAAHDERGCAIAYHNLAMISADRQLWDDADSYYQASLEIAESTSDVQMRGLVLLNRTEVYLARQRYEDARRSAEEALRVFDGVESRLYKAEAYKFLGMLYRETGQPALAEARFRGAIELAEMAGSPLSEAETSREMALLFQNLGRSQDALKLLNTSHRLFRRLDARADLVDVNAKVSHLEGVYLSIVRDWGRSIESSDCYTFGHSERVATYGEALASAYGLDAADVTTVRIGAYLHDLGKVRIPHEILNKPGRLTPEEFEMMKMHPEYGLEMLASVEFPWEIKPVIRSHHEKMDGSGYPDRLRGDEIPLSAQIICMVDVFDALTTNRSYRTAMPLDRALGEIEACRRWWRSDVFDAFWSSPVVSSSLAA
ncbi:MAG: HD domain-containing phosphohydrolase [Gemmatimonadaceae bacterium]